MRIVDWSSAVCSSDLLYHQHFNAGKRSVTLNIECDDGAKILRRLAKHADVLIESAPPGKMDQLGVGRDAMKAVNRELIYASVTPFGQLGPMAHYQAPDLIPSAMSGLTYLNGFPEDPPNPPGGEQDRKSAQ